MLIKCAYHYLPDPEYGVELLLDLPCHPRVLQHEQQCPVERGGGGLRPRHEEVDQHVHHVHLALGPGEGGVAGGRGGPVLRHSFV